MGLSSARMSILTFPAVPAAREKYPGHCFHVTILDLKATVRTCLKRQGIPSRKLGKDGVVWLIDDCGALEDISY